jgi:hypothetical protein
MQELVDRLRTDRESLRQAVENLSEAQLDLKPGESEWSISDIVHHLALAEEATLKLASRLLAEAESRGVPEDPDPQGSVLDVLDPLRVNLAKRAKAPERVTPRSAVPVADSLRRLDISRERLLARIQELARYDLALLSFPHPLLGQLNLYQWLLLVGDHEERHAAQIKRMT